MTAANQTYSGSPMRVPAGAQLTVLAEPSFIRGHTNKIGKRWVALVANAEGVFWECPHAHFLKREALACPAAKDLIERYE